jgi:hypothetical protein
MTHAQIIRHLDQAAEGILALSQATKQRPGPPTVSPPRFLAIALTHVEDAVARVSAAEGLERAWESKEIRP